MSSQSPDDENLTPDAAQWRMQLERLAREMHGPGDGRGEAGTHDLLAGATAAAVRLLPAADYAGVTLIRRKIRKKRVDARVVMELNASTGPIPKLINQLQTELGQGPFYDAIWDHETVRVPDVITERRWPTLMAAIAERTPVRALLSIQLFIDDKQLGSLNLLSHTPNAFDADTEHLAVNLAAHTAIALSGAQRGEQFQSALASRDIIGQAKGIIMERFDIDSDDAFELLTRLSQETNTRLADLATQLIERDHPDVKRADTRPSSPPR